MRWGRSKPPEEVVANWNVEIMGCNCRETWGLLCVMLDRMENGSFTDDMLKQWPTGTLHRVVMAVDWAAKRCKHPRAADRDVIDWAKHHDGPEARAAYRTLCEHLRSRGSQYKMPFYIRNTLVQLKIAEFDTLQNDTERIEVLIRDFVPVRRMHANGVGVKVARMYATVGTVC